MRLLLASCIAITSILRVVAETLPTSVEVTIEPEKFGDTASILKVDSTVAAFRFDQPVKHLALVLESRPKEPRTVHVARLALELMKPVKEGRFCVQMVDQGFLPLGNGSPNQMQLFMQIDCGGTLISSSQSFLKEKFNLSRSRARTGSGALTRKVEGNRAPVFWMMGNSDTGTYFNDEDLDKMIAKNKDAYVLIAYLEVAMEAPLLAEASTKPVETVSPGSPPVSAPERPADAAQATIPAAGPSAFVGPPAPTPVKEVVKSAAATPPSTTPKASTTPTSKSSGKSTSSKSSQTAAKKKKKSR